MVASRYTGVALGIPALSDDALAQEIEQFLRALQSERWYDYVTSTLEGLGDRGEELFDRRAQFLVQRSP